MNLNKKYTAYLKRYSKRIIDEAIKDGDFEVIGFMGSKNLIMKNHIEEYIKKSSENGGLCTGYFIDYRNKKFRTNTKKVCALRNFVVIYLSGKKTAGAKYIMGVEQKKE